MSTPPPPLTSTNLSALDSNLLILPCDGEVCNLLHNTINFGNYQFSGYNRLFEKRKTYDWVMIVFCIVLNTIWNSCFFHCFWSAFYTSAQNNFAQNKTTSFIHSEKDSRLPFQQMILKRQLVTVQSIPLRGQRQWPVVTNRRYLLQHIQATLVVVSLLCDSLHSSQAELHTVIKI